MLQQISESRDGQLFLPIFCLEYRWNLIPIYPLLHILSPASFLEPPYPILTSNSTTRLSKKVGEHFLMCSNISCARLFFNFWKPYSIDSSGVCASTSSFS